MCYSAVAVANFFIKKSLDNNILMTHMHLQKMLFFAHAFYYKHNGKPLISDPFVAWQHGPVIETLYHDLKKYKDGKITDLIVVPKPDNTDVKKLLSFRAVTPYVNEEDSELIQYLNSVWNSLAHVETWRLRSLSHKEGGAWYKTVKTLKKENGDYIDPSKDDDVKKYLPRNLTILDSFIKECGR